MWWITNVKDHEMCHEKDCLALSQGNRPISQGHVKFCWSKVSSEVFVNAVVKG